MSVKMDALSRVRVLKFGGSSLARPSGLASVVAVVEEARRRGPTVVVVSAFGDTTDALVDAARAASLGKIEESRAGVAAARDAVIDPVVAVARARGVEWDDVAARVSAEQAPLLQLFDAIAALGDCSPATLDRVLAFGELVSSSVITELLLRLGVPAQRLDARAVVVTDGVHGDARALPGPTRERLERALAGFLGGEVLVVPGFVGATREGATTTLGRNGSDYTAAILAAALGARSVTTYTDVPGVMTADPSLVDDAYAVPRLSYREALELAGVGLRMFHPRAIAPLAEANIPLEIKSTERPDAPGTLVDAEGSTDEARPTCVASLEGLTLFDLESLGSEPVAPALLAALSTAGVEPRFVAVAPRGNGVAFAVRAEDVERARTAAERVRALEREVGPLRATSPVSLVTLVAEAMGRTANVAGRFFGALGAAGIVVRAASQGATSRAIACVVADADTLHAVRAVHAAFNLATERIDVLLLGKGAVGGQLLAQLAAQRDALRERHDVDLRLVGVADRRASVFEPSGLDPRSVRARLEAAPTREDSGELVEHLARAPVAVLVDCTAADGMEAVYDRAIARGVHVVTANKKPFAAPAPSRDALFVTARARHRALRYETTVGASLPVIATLQDMVRTGDRVLSIEGSLSGTLGYLANEVSRGVALSTAVREARERGYTEPHPGDDLSGTDAARKALILAREIGLALELGDVEVEPFVPAALLAEADVGAFLESLRAHDEVFARRVRGLRDEGRVLRYLATIQPGDGATPPRVRVGPVGVAADHPAARLRGTEALVAFTTERYRESPLVVQGSGAGGAVTAAGVLADVLAIARARRGR